VKTNDRSTDPTGALLVIDIATRTVVRTIALAGQPDAITVASSGGFAAIPVENERDEDLDEGPSRRRRPGPCRASSSRRTWPTGRSGP
jgi:hypothetical protein